MMSYLCRPLGKYLDVTLIILIIALAFLSLTRSFGYPVFSIYIETLLGSDKWLHFIAGFSTTLSIFRTLSRWSLLNSKSSILISCSWTVFILSFDEISQFFNVNRRFDLNDLFIGLSGMAFVSLILICIELSLSNNNELKNI